MVVKVIAGDYQGKQGVVKSLWPVTYLDFKFSGSAQTNCSIPAKHNSLLYIYNGTLTINNKHFAKGTTVIFNQSDLKADVSINNSSSSQAGAIFLSGLPIGEKVAQHGPFVMNSNEQLAQAFDDYNNGKNGFENSRTWTSEIRNLSFQKQ